ncbi:MAG: spermidine synthase [Actinomycetia bacterium]|nr:spermidine synthase [Actinomycetes bacterium]
MTRRSARALVFTTSAAVLVLEILAGRLLAPFVGVSLETFTGIIGTILAGIALGSGVGGKMADHRPPSTMIGPAISLGGVLAWGSLPIVTATGPAFGNGPMAIVLVSALAFFLPACVLSAVSPMVAKLRLSDLGETGEVVGGLSAAGTLGALFGTFFTGFVLVSAVPTRPVIIGLGGLLVVLGVAIGVRLGGAKPDLMMATIGVATLAAAALSSSPCEFETAYFCGSVIEDAERPSIRVLELDDLRHAAIDLDDPTWLEFRYTNLIADVVDAMPAGTVTALHVGGGGFTMPRYVEATRPGSDSLVLEIDPFLVDVAKDELGLVTSDRLRVEVGDARLAVDDIEAGVYDIVVGDAFASVAVPWHLTTREFVAEIARSLKPDGIYVMNVIDGGESHFARAELATLASEFEHVGAIIPPDGVRERPVNQILLASQLPLPALDIDGEHGVLVDDVDAYIDGARVLTDDFAPVDWLTRDR